MVFPWHGMNPVDESANRLAAPTRSPVNQCVPIFDVETRIYDKIGFPMDSSKLHKISKKNYPTNVYPDILGTSQT